MKIFSKTLLLTLTSLTLLGCANQQEASQSSQALVHVSEEVVKEELQQVSGGNVASLAGKWVNGQGTDWIINSKGNLVTGESIRLSEAMFNEEGILLELVDGSKTSTVLLIPEGAPHGQSDASKNRLLLYDKGLSTTASDYFYYQD